MLQIYVQIGRVEFMSKYKQGTFQITNFLFAEYDVCIGSNTQT